MLEAHDWLALREAKHPIAKLYEYPEKPEDNEECYKNNIIRLLNQLFSVKNFIKRISEK